MLGYVSLLEGQNIEHIFLGWQTIYPFPALQAILSTFVDSGPQLTFGFPESAYRRPRGSRSLLLNIVRKKRPKQIQGLVNVPFWGF